MYPTLSEPPRFQALRFFRDNFPGYQNVQPLSNVTLPSFTAMVVSEIATAKAIPFDLALLGFLPSIAAADCGHSRVVLSDGSTNSLSLFIAVGADSGIGKSRALEDSLKIFSDWEHSAHEVITTENQNRNFANSLIDERIKVLGKKYAKTGEQTVLEEIYRLKNQKVAEHSIPHLLLSDATEAALSQHLIDHGIAIRLESDGVLLPKKAMRLMTKSWSGERISRHRMTAPSGVIEDPFVVDLVMTQPEFFRDVINTPDFLESGLMARTLPYYYQDMWCPRVHPRPMDENTLGKLREKLLSLLNASNFCKQNPSGHRTIPVSKDAEDLLRENCQNWTAQAKSASPLYRVREFVARMPQHALRLAGCLYLAEYPVNYEYPIPAPLMQTALHMTEVFLSHVLRWTIKDYGDVHVECCRAIMQFILEKNFSNVSETVLKQALRHRFKAADVSIAIYYLVSQNYLYESLPEFTGTGKRGRPAGRTLFNPYYDQTGCSF